MRISRALRRSLSDFKIHPWLHVISIATVMISLFILGGVFLVYRNFERVAENTSPNITGTIYLKDGLTEATVAEVSEKVRHLNGVIDVRFKSRYSVLDELREFLGSAPSETLPGAELFPDVMEIEVASQLGGDDIIVLKASLSKMAEVAEADFSEDWLLQYRRVRQVLRIVALALMIAVVVGCSFIIANFMGMRHQSRRQEIEVARLIGARERFVLSPLLWEGLIEGLTGAGLALVLLYVLKSVLATLLTVQWASVLGVKSWLYLSSGQTLLVVVVGIAMAVSGSITVFLRFQEDSSR